MYLLHLESTRPSAGELPSCIRFPPFSTLQSFFCQTCQIFVCKMYLFELINVFVALGIDESIDYPSCNGIATRHSWLTAVRSRERIWSLVGAAASTAAALLTKISSEETFLQRSAPPQSANRQVESFLGNYSMILVSNIGEQIPGVIGGWFPSLYASF